ncbi:MAG: hypothetical protein AB8B71_16365 [Paracoccaceae bacterium]
MAAFLLGVAVGWIFTFALWSVWSFGLLSSLLLGAMAGTIAIFAFLMAQRLPRGLIEAQHDIDNTVKKAVRVEAEKAGFRSDGVRASVRAARNPSAP